MTVQKWIEAVDRPRSVGRGNLTEAQWAVWEMLLPRAGNPVARPQNSGRKLIDGIRIRTHTGTLWRDVPERYGSTSTPSSRRGPTPVA
ncbi:transposase [Streptomyces sp. NPDC057557]|uniref:transposase n=1 Tax=Streptomyces sp. NPDC057557 TaxID=3346167 RepID=UPI0036A1107E